MFERFSHQLVDEILLQFSCQIHIQFAKVIQSDIMKLQ